MDARDILNEGQKNRSILDETYGAMLEQKWDKFLTHLPKGDKTRRRLGAFWLQNQSDHLIESTQKPGGGLSEDVTTANIAYYTRFIFPILRKLLANLFAPDLVSVQPMSAPYGAFFYWDVKYGKTKGIGATAGQSWFDNFDRFYSSEHVDREQLVVGDGVNYGGAGAPLAASLSWKPVRPLDLNVPFRCRIQQINNVTGAVVQEAIDNGAGGFTGAVTSGTINYATGAITNFKFTAAPAVNHIIAATYEYDSENNPLIADAYLDLTMLPVIATSRKLKFRMSSEAMDDLRTVHGLDGDAEMSDAEAQHMALEIDREIIMDLYAGASAPGDTFDFAVPAGMDELSWKRGFLTRLSKVSAGIHMATMRGPANFLVCGPMVAAHLEQLQTRQDFAPIFARDYTETGGFEGQVVPEGIIGPTTTQFGIQRLGTLSRKWVLYQDPYFPVDKVLVGYKGPSVLHAGYVYGPYVPMQVTSVFLNPEDFSLVKGMRTRYAKKLLHDGKFYGIITCSHVV